MKQKKQKTHKYEKVKEKIKQMIYKGEFPPGFRLPADLKLYKQFRVSLGTAVKAVEELTQEGILVRRRGSGTYVADKENPPLIKGRNVKLGIIWADWVTPERMGDGIEGHITQGIFNRIGLPWTSFEFQSSDNRQETVFSIAQPERGVYAECIGPAHSSRERHPSIKYIQSGDFDACIIISVMDDTWLDKVCSSGIPVVLADYISDDFSTRADQVYIDPYSGFQTAARYFIRKGYTKIHFIGSKMWPPAPTKEMTRDEWFEFRKGKKTIDPDSYLRMSAYRHEMEINELRVGDEYIHFELQDPKYLKPLARKIAELPKKTRPEAVVCHNAEMADVVIDVFQEKGLPLEGSGAAHGNFKGKAIPILADLEEMGRAAAELAVSRIEKPDRSFLNVGVRMKFPVGTRKSERGTRKEETRPAKHGSK
ncbi:GntR family transcriptional regulator [Planctomycetota bacterium]